MSKKLISRKTSVFLGPSGVSIFHRLLAKGIDLIFILVLFFLCRAFWTPLGFLGAALFAWTQDWMGEGQSLGKRIIGLRTLDESNGIPCTLFASFMRNLPLGIVILFSQVPVLDVVVFFGFALFALLEVYLLINLETGVRLGDVMANTIVVDHFEMPSEAPHLTE